MTTCKQYQLPAWNWHTGRCLGEVPESWPSACCHISTTTLERPFYCSMVCVLEIWIICIDGFLKSFQILLAATDLTKNTCLLNLLNYQKEKKNTEYYLCFIPEVKGYENFNVSSALLLLICFEFVLKFAAAKVPNCFGSYSSTVICTEGCSLLSVRHAKVHQVFLDVWMARSPSTVLWHTATV